MRTRSIFDELHLPSPRENRKLPILLDFSIGRAPEDFFYAQALHEIVCQTAEVVDGLIMMPRNLPGLEVSQGKEVWVRADWTSAFNPTKPGMHEFVIPLLSPRYWDQAGIAGIIGSLLLGNSACQEADNIQYLATQRSNCYEIGVPMVIDLHIVDKNVDHKMFNEIIELGMTLAVELGCDAIIVPGGDYLVSNKNIDQIVDIPIMARVALGEGMLGNWSSNYWDHYLTKVDGIVFTDTIHWNEIVQDQEVFANTQA